MSDSPRAASPSKVKRSLLIVINSLHSGGAEKTCIELARDLLHEYDLEVVSLIIGGPAEQQLRSLGVKVTVMRIAGMGQKLKSCLQLARLLRSSKPDVVISFLYIADLVAGTMARMLVPRAKVFWNIRNNVLARAQVGTVSYVVCRLNALLSRIIPDTIVYCSAVARAQHEAIGFRVARGQVVENSSDSVPYAFSLEKRAVLRQGRFENDFTFLFVGRFDPVKRVDIYVEACVELCRRHGGNLRFLIAGRGMDSQNQWLRATLEASGYADRFELLGYVEDPQSVYSAADCLLVTSESEGSPNAVYEAMATRLQSIIFATVGTEAIGDASVRRLESRDMGKLVELMAQTASRGIPPNSMRQRDHGDRRIISAHPLVQFYRSELRCV